LSIVLQHCTYILSSNRFFIYRIIRKSLTTKVHIGSISIFTINMQINWRHCPDYKTIFFIACTHSEAVASKNGHFGALVIPNLVAIFQDLLFLLFLDIGLLLTGKLLNQGFLVFKKSSLQKFYSNICHNHNVNHNMHTFWSSGK
jgi:hypothetical protein